MQPTAIDHYTIETGHNHLSPRSEVSDEAVALCRPLTRDGTHNVPNCPGYTLKSTRANGTLAATVFRGPAPLVTLFVCTDNEGLGQVLKMTGCIPAVKLDPPSLLVQAEVGLSLDHDALGWLGDFERCLAWSWVEERES